MLSEIFKNKGDPSSCNNYRDVLLSDVSSKVVGRFIRSRLLPFAVALSVDTQFGGGFHGGETAFAHLYVRLIMDMCQQTNMSVAILFLDVSAAFASLLRRIVFDFEEGDERWLNKLRSTGFSDTDVSDIYKFVTEYCWVNELGSTSSMPFDKVHSYRLAEQFFRNTWVSQESLPNVLNIKSGCCAGTPLADLIYSMAMSRVLKLMRSTIRIDCLESTIKVAGIAHTCTEVSFVDDVAMPIISPACELVSKCCAITSIAFRVFKCFGMDLNFETNKSEAIIKHRGVGAKSARIALHRSGDEVQVHVLDNLSVQLRFVKCYKHLGTRTSVSHDLSDEVVFRAQLMRSESQRLRKLLTRRGDMSVEKKVSIIQAYVLSKGIFQASTWPALPNSLYKRFHRSIMDMYRDTTGTFFCAGTSSDMYSDEEVVYKFNLVNPMTLIRSSRLKLFLRIVSKSPPHILELIFASQGFHKGWAGSVHADLRWLTLCNEYSQCYGFCLKQWRDHFANNVHTHSRRIRQHCYSPVANIVSTSVEQPSLVGTAPDSYCPDCDKAFHSQQQLALHRFRTHGYKDPVRMSAPFTFCLVCLREFHTRERVLNHLRYRSKTCKYNLMLKAPFLTEAEADSLDEECKEANVSLQHKGCRRHLAAQPSFRLQGPLLPIILAPDSKESCHHPLGFGHNLS